MNLLQIVSLILLVPSFVWVLLLLRRHKDLGLVIVAITVGSNVVYELLELLEVPGIGSPGRERVWAREITVKLVVFLVVYLRGRSLARYSRLEEKLRQSVDLIDLRKASAVFRVQILKDAALLVDTDPGRRAEFECFALANYARLNEERAGILEDVRRSGRVHG